MLTYYFEKNTTPLYNQLYQYIKKDIVSGNLKANTKLPSKRQLAAHLDLSIITIQAAYEQLLIEGYIYSIEKKGYYVCKLQKPTKATFHPFSNKRIEKTHIQIDLLTNSIAKDTFPFTTFANITRKVLSNNQDDILQRCPSQGYLPLCNAICEHLYTFKGMNVSPDQIVIGAGSENLYSILIHLLGTDHHIGIENPGHKSIAKIYELNGLTPIYLPLDEYGLSYKALSKTDVDLIHISSAHHYPTGITMVASRRYEILNWAIKNNALIIEDDYDSEFRMQGKPINPLFQMDENDCVIYMNTFSKTIAPSFRIGYMVLPKHLCSKYKEKLSFLSCNVSLLDQIIIAEFINKKYFEKHINRMRNQYRILRNNLIDAIEKAPFYHMIKIKEEDAGLHFLLEINTTKSDNDIINYALSISLKIGMLSMFYENYYDSHIMLINYSGLTNQIIPDVIEKLILLFAWIEKE